LRRIPWVVFFGFVLALSFACGPQETISIGNKEPTGPMGAKTTNMQKIAQDLSNLIDTYATVPVVFLQKMSATPKPGYTCLRVKDDFSQLTYYVLVKQGLYEAEIAKLKKDMGFRVYGTVTMAELPTDPDSTITIQIDE